MTSDKWKIISLDWDKFTWHKAYKIIKFIFNDRQDIKKIRVYSSPNLDGYHIYIYFDHWLEWSEVLKLRRKYHDDDKRLINDLFKTNPEEKMILFQNKNGKKEIFMYEFWSSRFEMPSHITSKVHASMLGTK